MQFSNGSGMRALGVYAQVLAKRYGIQVVADPSLDTAMTNGKRIVIGQKFLSVGNDDDATRLFGLITHEACHIILTDFDWLNARAKQSDWTPLLKQLSNILEDLWIEDRFGGMHRGARIDLVAANVLFLKDGFYSAPKFGATAHPAAVLLGWVMHHG